MQFAAGQLPNALGVMVACHLEACAQCRAHTQLYDRLGGELLLESPVTEIKTDLLSGLLNRLDEPATGTAIASSNVGDIRVPRPLRRFVPGFYDQLPWTGMTRSIKEFKLPFSDSHYTAKFYKISAGSELPEHTHRGNEFTLVMEGSFRDKAGSYRQGDFILADTNTVHQPRASQECDCICFAVLDAPLKMTGFFGRMLNPFLS